MNLAKKISFKLKFADFLLLSGLILTIIALIIQFVCAFISYKTIPDKTNNPYHLWTPDNIWVSIWTLVSTFTIQSTILVLFFFCFVLTNHFYEQRAKFIFGRFSLAITTYISITIIVFFALLFKPLLDKLDINNPLNIVIFANTFLLHLLIPLIVILHFMLNAGQNYWSYGKQVYLWMPLISLYMFLYLAYALLKGNFVGKFDSNKKEINYSFPYKFLNFHDNLTMFLIIIGAILFLYIILILFFTFYNNIIYKKKNEKEIVLRDIFK